MTARVIKRYGNRKLYDVDASAYVSMEELAELIREGHTLQVIDNVSGEDITAQTLTQVVLEQGRRGGGLMPTDLLHDLLRRGGKAFDAGVEQLRHGVEGVAQRALAPLTRVVQAPQEKASRSARSPHSPAWCRRRRRRSCGGCASRSPHWNRRSASCSSGRK
jgi:polyhydroxyalkanoate synthesis repressor PhaR